VFEGGMRSWKNLPICLLDFEKKTTTILPALQPFAENSPFPPYLFVVVLIIFTNFKRF
jgi:hypothetical protein